MTAIGEGEDGLVVVICISDAGGRCCSGRDLTQSHVMQWSITHVPCHRLLYHIGKPRSMVCLVASVHFDLE